MRKDKEFPAKTLNLLLLITGILILLHSVEVLMRVKDVDVYENWQKAVLASGVYPEGITPSFSDYVGTELFRYFFRIAIPMAFGLYTFLTAKKLGVSALYLFVWTVTLFGGMAYTFFELNFSSLFYYLIIAGYLVLIITLLSLTGDTQSKRNHKGGERSW